MVRAQIQLPEDQYRHLQTAARRRGISFADLVRQLLDRGLQGEAIDRGELYEHAARLIGAFRSPEADLSARHDEHLEDTYR